MVVFLEVAVFVLGTVLVWDGTVGLDSAVVGEVLVESFEQVLAAVVLALLVGTDQQMEVAVVQVLAHIFSVPVVLVEVETVFPVFGIVVPLLSY